jgi:hypothetical protein
MSRAFFEFYVGATKAEWQSLWVSQNLKDFVRTRITPIVTTWILRFLRAAQLYNPKLTYSETSAHDTLEFQLIWVAY